jgi:hypothetical protein
MEVKTRKLFFLNKKERPEEAPFLFRKKVIKKT